MKKFIVAAMILSSAVVLRPQPAQAGGSGVGIAIGAAAGLVAGAAITAAVTSPHYYYAPPVTYVPAYPPPPMVYMPAPTVYAAPALVYAPAPAPAVIYQAPVVQAPPAFGATVVIGGGPRYHYGYGPRVVVRGRW